MTWLLAPPIAFLIYVALVGILSYAGKRLAGPASPNPIKSSTYSGGEMPSQQLATPGYRPFFRVALFFAILHLGALIIATTDLSLITIIYITGLIFTLLALILG